MHEAPFLGSVPTVVVVAAMEELGRQLGRYGPSNVLWAVRKKGSRTLWAFGSLEFTKF